MNIKKFRILTGLELVVCFLIIIYCLCAKNTVPEGDLTEQLLKEGVPLKAGIYDVKIMYSAQEDMACSFGVEAEAVPFRNLRSNSVTLFADEHENVCRFYLAGPVEELKVFIKDDGDIPVKVSGLELTYIGTAGWAGLVGIICLFALINIYIVIYLYHKEKGFDRLSQTVIVMLTIAGLCASLPLLVDYVFDVEGMYEVIYAVENVGGDFGMWTAYGNISLLIPALLRRIGFSAGAAYRLYLAFINIATVSVSYMCFRRTLSDRMSALFGCILYTLNIYRLNCMYTRPSPEETVGMVFIPVLAAGFMILIFEDRNRKMSIPLLLTGITGIFLCHLNIESIAELASAVIAFVIVIVFETAAKIFLTHGGMKNAKIIMGAISMGIILIAACRNDNILREEKPLWVYSASDLVHAKERGLTFLISETYGIQ